MASSVGIKDMQIQYTNKLHGTVKMSHVSLFPLRPALRTATAAVRVSIPHTLADISNVSWGQRIHLLPIYSQTGPQYTAAA